MDHLGIERFDELKKLWEQGNQRVGAGRDLGTVSLLLLRDTNYTTPNSLLLFYFKLVILSYVFLEHESLA